jgi:hypothetical protein
MATTRQHRRKHGDPRLPVCADRLELLIWAWGESVNALAKRAGPRRTSQQNLDYIVRGRNRRARKSLLAWLARDLGVSLEYLTGESNVIGNAVPLVEHIAVFYENLRPLVKSRAPHITLRTVQRVARHINSVRKILRELPSA